MADELPPLTPPFETFARPAEHERWRRFWWGFLLPFRLLAKLRKNPEAWAMHTRVARRQALITFMTGSAILALVSWGVYELFAWAAAHPDAKLDVGRGADLVVKVATGIVGIYGACEWLVIALSRERREQSSRRIALAVGLPPEDPERPPRIRLDLRWMWRRVRRWGRGVRTLVAVLPALVIAGIPIAMLVGTDRVNAILAFLWGWYWATVLACAKTVYAWRSEGVAGARDPWFVRVLMKLPVIRLYGRFVRWMSRTSAPPAREIEPHFLEFAGLAVARTAAALPGVYAFVRPSLPVAAAHILATAKEHEPDVLSAPRDLP